MKKILIILMTALLCMSCLTSVFAANDPDAVIDPSRTGEIRIDYKDDVEGTDPVTGAEFTAYKVAVYNPEGGYESVIPGLEQISDDTDPEKALELIKNPEPYSHLDEETDKTDKTEKAGQKHTAVTDKNGQAVIKDLESGLYLVEESKAAEDHFASRPFFVAVPHTEGNAWVYDITVEPKSQPAGKLKVSKTVSSTLDDKQKEFHFTVTFENVTEKIHYTKSDKSEGSIKSGDTVTLKHGEHILFDMIPVGTAYRVTEKEADCNGYITTATNASGNIRRTEIMEAAFTNSQTPPATGDDYLVYIAGGTAGAALILAVIMLIRLRNMRKEG